MTHSALVLGLVGIDNCHRNNLDFRCLRPLPFVFMSSTILHALDSSPAGATQELHDARFRVRRALGKDAYHVALSEGFARRCKQGLCRTSIRLRVFGGFGRS
jgi:hypothetical protein